jgi:cyclopropane fatty-acyl-phospholipid synthase-like methyltransferase
LSPLPIVSEATSLFFSKIKNVLDIGSGSGRNAIYLALLGFNVDAIDRSELAIKELSKYAKSNLLPIQTRVQDVQFSIPEFNNYDLVVCTQILHYLKASNAKLLLSKARLNAQPGTVHVIGAITNSGDFSKLYLAKKYFYPEPSQISKIYKTEGWIIHSDYDMEREMKQLSPSGSRMRNIISFLIAQKQE